MSASLSGEYKEIQELVAASKSIATALKKTLSRIRDNDPALNKNGRERLYMGIGWICGAERCYDIVLEKIGPARRGAPHETPLPRATTVVSDEELECFSCGKPIPYGQAATLNEIDTGMYYTICETCRKPEERTAK